MRPHLFVAVVPPPRVREQLDELVSPIRTGTPDVAWEAPSRWHVTLCFLGQVDPAPVLLHALEAVARSTPPLPIRLAGAGCFGEHVLWAGVDGPLEPVAAQLKQAAGDAGVTVEDRPFRPHLTLARRRRRGTTLRPLAARLASVSLAPWTADELVLLSSGRPDYERVAGWPLTG